MYSNNIDNTEKENDYREEKIADNNTLINMLGGLHNVPDSTDQAIQYRIFISQFKSHPFISFLGTALFVLNPFWVIYESGPHHESWPEHTRLPSLNNFNSTLIRMMQGSVALFSPYLPESISLFLQNSVEDRSVTRNNVEELQEILIMEDKEENPTIDNIISNVNSLENLNSSSRMNYEYCRQILHDSASFMLFAREREQKDLIDHRNDTPKDRRRYDEQYGLVPVSMSKR